MDLGCIKGWLAIGGVGPVDMFGKGALIVDWFIAGVPRREVGGLVKFSGISFQFVMFWAFEGGGMEGA